jgi:putative ATPase
MTGSLFPDADASELPGTPLAERMRPRSLDEYVGQTHLLGPGRPLRRALDSGALHSLIFWGPPGTGKTTLGRLLAAVAGAEFLPVSAVTTGIKEVKEIIAAAERRRQMRGTRTVLFVDEIHRFNKAQQDAFLPRVEAGDIVLIGATTENPSFEVNAALLSRSKVFVLQPLGADAVETILRRALEDRDRGLGAADVRVSDEAVAAMARFANGDARAALNLLEFSVAAAPMDPTTFVRQLDLAQLEQSIHRRALLYDKGGEEHYNLISALHKSMRNSDPDAAVYWVARMLEAGEDPLYIARRLVRFASEDIGNADPQALVVAVAAKDAAHFIGMPEGNTALAQAAIYLATAPKSNAVYTAYGAAAADAHTQAADPVPLHLRNAPTKLMKQLDYGKGYQYAHNERDAVADMECLPDALADRTYYRPTERGFEKEIKRRLEGWEKIKQDRRQKKEES